MKKNPKKPYRKRTIPPPAAASKKTTAAASTSPLLGPVIVWIVEQGTGENAAEKIAAHFKISTTEASALVAVAWERIKRAGICDVQTELGLAKKQNEKIFRAALDAGNFYAAQSARNELSKLLRLYDAVNLAAIDEAFVSETERLTREHLENLKITDQGLPLEELARRVALFLVNNINGEQFEASTRRLPVRTKETRQRKKEP